MNGNKIVSAAMRGRNPQNPSDRTAGCPTEQRIEISNKELSNCITTVQKDSLITNGLRIRKMTPKECWRLMGFNDYDFEKAERVNSNTQLYKQAGNSIVVNVLVKIFTNLLKEEKEVEEVKIRKFKTDKMIDVNKLLEKEPELFEELFTDYPVEAGTTLIYEVN